MGVDTNMEGGFYGRRQITYERWRKPLNTLSGVKARLLGAWAGNCWRKEVAGAAKFKRDYRRIYLRRPAGTADFLQLHQPLVSSFSPPSSGERSLTRINCLLTRVLLPYSSIVVRVHPRFVS